MFLEKTAELCIRLRRAAMPCVIRVATQKFIWAYQEHPHEHHLVLLEINLASTVCPLVSLLIAQGTPHTVGHVDVRDHSLGLDIQPGKNLGELYSVAQSYKSFPTSINSAGVVKLHHLLDDVPSEEQCSQIRRPNEKDVSSYIYLKICRKFKSISKEVIAQEEIQSVLVQSMPSPDSLEDMIRDEVKLKC
ncbi:hypothetical protein LAZ67_10001209 [Cordylochernes scorpioides]|uniref:Uncharacterized protein n=1 Tax=Cordylochernes scorpioides TaxID=51811 RepID=A0ABY6KXU5_9ARAC|nr:hypothetical protein LAZ67_10001209 [Cordylochernes scorpioides]